MSRIQDRKMFMFNKEHLITWIIEKSVSNIHYSKLWTFGEDQANYEIFIKVLKIEKLLEYTSIGKNFKTYKQKPQAQHSLKRKRKFNIC